LRAFSAKFSAVILISIDKLLFEKVQNMIIKDIVGVHSKAFNPAVRNELGIYPLCIKSYPGKKYLEIVNLIAL
jgi:hypothetical protein